MPDNHPDLDPFAHRDDDPDEQPDGYAVLDALRGYFVARLNSLDLANYRCDRNGGQPDPLLAGDLYRAERVAVRDLLKRLYELERPRPDDHLGLPPAAPEQGEPDRPDGVPDQAGRERALPRPVGQLRQSGVSGGGAVPDTDATTAGYFHQHNRWYDPYPYLCRYQHAHTGNTPGHDHPDQRLGPRL